MVKTFFGGPDDELKGSENRMLVQNNQCLLHSSVKALKSIAFHKPLILHLHICRENFILLAITPGDHYNLCVGL